MGTMTQRYPICDQDTGRFFPWWKNFVQSLGNFDLGSSDFVFERDRVLRSVDARFVLDWSIEAKAFERAVEFEDANAGLMFILKWS